MKRRSFEQSRCAVARALDEVGDCWTMMILRDVFEGSHRFGEFERKLGIPKRALSSRLKAMVVSDILATVPASDGSAYKEYILTEKGSGLFHVMVALRQWGEAHLFANETSPASTLVDAKTGRAVGTLALHSAEGGALGMTDTVVVYDEPTQGPAC
jgi:DNA-binding HxlR family transcriptional regulator